MASVLSTRDRLIDTAARLFYAEGITATGVDTVVAQSGVSKPTLYRHFGSKAAMVAAVLEDLHLRRRQAVTEYVDAHACEPRERLLAVFDWLGDWHASEGSRGCAFLNAAAELAAADQPARAVIAGHKRWTRDYLSSLATDAQLHEPETLAYELLLLIDGANARVLVEGDLHAASHARRVAELLVERAEAPLPSSPRSDGH